MQQSHPKFLEDLTLELLCHGCRGTQVRFLRFLNQGIHHIDLLPLAQRLPHEIIALIPTTLVAQLGDDRQPPGRELIDDRYLQVPIHGHGKCAWDGGCGHDQDIWIVPLALQHRPLEYAEAMLLIDDCQAKCLEPNPS